MCPVRVECSAHIAASSHFMLAWNVPFIFVLPQAERLEALARQMCNQGARMAALHEKRRQEEQELARRCVCSGEPVACALCLGS